MISEFFLTLGTLEQWQASLYSFFGLIIIFKFSQYLLLNQFKKIAEKTKNSFDDFLVSIFLKGNWLVFIIFSLFVSTKFLNLNETVNNVIDYVALVTLIIIIANFLQNFINRLALKKFEENEEEGKKTDASVVKTLSIIAGWGIWIIAVLLILQNSGVNIGALLAGAGIFGIAIAFALKEALADLFACLSIYLDKPFEVGDYIVIDSKKKGTIRKIGLRTTRLKTLRGEELVISNRNLTDSSLYNYKKMEKRRVSFEVYVDGKTTITKLEKGKKIIANIFLKKEEIELSKTSLTSFDGRAWTYEIVYYVNSRSYDKYLIAHEEILLALKKGFDKEKIKFETDIQKIIVKNN